MSRELFKSMVYKDGKVFTRQCSNNEYPKDYYSEENKSLTRLYNELGETNFEKWFLTNGVMQGSIVILSGSNKTLKKLKYIRDLLWNDDNFRKLHDSENKIFMKSLSSNTQEEKDLAHKEYLEITNNIKEYISDFYDKNIPKFKEIERGR